MSKVDLKNAFRLCPVHPDDWHLLGIHWRGHYYVDKCLPFGLRSAPYLFNMVANAVQWILSHHFQVANFFHYLDDLFFAGPADMLMLCHTLNIPLKQEKIVNPTTCMTFLGIELDTASQIARLPQDKLITLVAELHSFASLYQLQQTCTKRQLLSLIGKLSFACKVIPAGRIQPDPAKRKDLKMDSFKNCMRELIVQYSYYIQHQRGPIRAIASAVHVHILIKEL